MRSTILHDEVSCVIYDEGIAADYAAVYEDDLRSLPRLHDRRLVGARPARQVAQLVRPAVLAAALTAGAGPELGEAGAIRSTR